VDGKDTLNRLGFQRLAEIEGDIKHLKSIASPEAKPFLESQEGQLLLGDYINQFGPPTVLNDFVRGQQVALNHGQNKIQLTGPLTFGMWWRYVHATEFGQNEPKIIGDRFTNVQNTMRRLHIAQDAPRLPPRTRPTPTPGGFQGQQPAALLRVPGNGSPQSHPPATPPPLPGRRSGLEGGQSKAAAPDAIAARAASGEDPANTPEGRKLLAAFSAEPGGAAAVAEILSVPVLAWTEEQVEQVRSLTNNAPDYRGTPGLQDKVKDWRKHFYGADPDKRLVAYDATGRMLPARPIRPIPRIPTPPRTADGGDLNQTVRIVGRRVLATAAETGLPEAIKGLQRGLNGLTGLVEAAAGVRPGGPQLAVDGIFGPKTRGRLRGALLSLGQGTVGSVLARGFAQSRPTGRRRRPTRLA
ncbi:MAG: hypothetical protein ACE5KL_03220, partial [Alphaproteobacteria bacterium]